MCAHSSDQVGTSCTVRCAPPWIHYNHGMLQNGSISLWPMWGEENQPHELDMCTINFNSVFIQCLTFFLSVSVSRTHNLNVAISSTFNCAMGCLFYFVNEYDGEKLAVSNWELGCLPN